MKKLLLGSALVLSGMSGYSQMEIREHLSTVSNEEDKATFTALAPSSIRAASGSSSPIISAIGDTIFTETFGNGLNGDGSNGAWSNSGAPATALWEYRGTSTTPDITTGSRGAFNGTRGPLASATASNGFFVFDSDYLDNGGVVGNFGLGPAPSPHTGYLESPVIDMSGYTNAVIQLTSYFRRFQSDCFIEFSIDGGNTWPYSIHVYGENQISVNAATPNANTTSHYLPSGIGGNSNVKFRLKFDGTDTSNPNGSGYYFWQVDDIYIIEAPDNDLAATQIYFNGIADSNSFGYDYTEIPERQASGHNMTFGTVFQNLGTVAQPNVKAGVEVTGPASASLVSTGSITSLAINATDSLDAGTFAPNGGQGTYTYSFYATSVDSLEDNPINDSINYDQDVTENFYSMATATNIGYRTTTATSSYEICVLFEIYAGDTATGMSVEFNHNTNDPNDPDNLVVGSDFLSFRVMDASAFDANNSYIGTNIAQYNSGGSSFYAVQAGDTGEVITVPLTHDASTPTLTPGGYYGCVKTFNPNAFMSSDNGRSDDNWRPGTTIVDIDDANDWGGFRVTPTIRLITKSSVDPCTGVTITATTNKDESTQTNGSITAVASGGTPSYSYSWLYPDGTTTGTTATINGLDQAGNYKLTVTDAFGCQSAEIQTDLAGCVGLADITASVVVDSVTGAIDLTVTGGSGSYTFNWTAAGNSGYSATTEDISGLSSDVYNVVITDDQCNTLTFTDAIPVFLVSTPEISFVEDLTIYPMPNDGNFVIDVQGAQEEVKLTIRNIIGQPIYTDKFGVGSYRKEVDLTNHAAGVYLVDFESASGEISTYKLIIE